MERTENEHDMYVQDNYNKELLKELSNDSGIKDVDKNSTQETDLPLTISDKFNLCFNYAPKGLTSNRQKILDCTLKEKYSYEKFKDNLEGKKLAPYADAIYEYLIIKKADKHLETNPKLSIEDQRSLIKAMIFLMKQTDLNKDSDTVISIKDTNNLHETLKLKGNVFHVKLLESLKALFIEQGMDLERLTYVEAYNKIVSEKENLTQEDRIWVEKYMLTSMDFREFSIRNSGYYDPFNKETGEGYTYYRSPEMVERYAMEHYKKNEITLDYLKQMDRNLGVRRGARPRYDDIGLLSERLLYLIHFDEYITQDEVYSIKDTYVSNDDYLQIFEVLDFFDFLDLDSKDDSMKKGHIKSKISNYGDRKEKILQSDTSYYLVEQSLYYYKHTGVVCQHFNVE